MNKKISKIISILLIGYIFISESMTAMAKLPEKIDIDAYIEFDESKIVLDYEGEPTDSKDIEDILNSSDLYCVTTKDKVIDARVEEILDEIITDDMSTYEKTEAIWNWIIENTYYQVDPGYYRMSYKTIQDTKVAAQCYSVLSYGYGSCVNYASAFVVLTRAIGLDSYVVRGAVINSNGSTYEHSWVNVNIHGTLYTFDAQLEDNMWNGSGEVPKNYFCKTDEEVAGRFSYGDREGDIDGFNYFIY